MVKNTVEPVVVVPPAPTETVPAAVLPSTGSQNSAILPVLGAMLMGVLAFFRFGRKEEKE